MKRGVGKPMIYTLAILAALVVLFTIFFIIIKQSLEKGLV